MLRRPLLAVLGLAASASPWLVLLLAGTSSATATVTLGPLGTSRVGALLGPVQAVLLSLVLLVATVVTGFVSTNLGGQRRVVRFGLLQGLLVAALALTVVTPSLLQLAVAWTVTSLTTAALVAHAGTSTARAASRRVLRSLLVGDVLVWSAALLAAATAGGTDLAGLVPGAPDVMIVAALLVGAGLVRSAQAPLHRWLQETTEAPSPVSALLHAGVVNGIGVVALVAWPLVAESWPARILAVVVGTATIGIGWATSRVRPDVKGRLVSSTAAQMGYLAVVAGLGLPAAVVVHVVGHGLWKATLFLGAGSAVERVRRSGLLPGRRSLAARVAAVVGACAVVLASAVAPWPGEHLLWSPATVLLVAAAALTASVAATSALRRQGAAAALSLGVVLATAAGYVLVVRALESRLSELLPPAAAVWGDPFAWVSVTAVVVLALAAVTAWRADRPAAVGGGRRLVRWATAQTLPTGVPPLGRATARPLPVDARGPVPTGEVSAAVQVVSEVVAPLWPLHAFVASNPLAGLEVLAFRDALDAGSRSWGARTGIDGGLFRLAVEQGAVDERVLDRICADVVAGPDVAVASPVRTRAELVRTLLLASALTEPLAATVAARLESLGRWSGRREELRTQGERAALSDARLVDADQRARDLVSAHAARVHGDPSWPTDGGVWTSLRGDAGRLDRLLGITGAGERVAALPQEPVDALAVLVGWRGGPGAAALPELTRLLARDPGWTAHLQWRRRVGLAVGHDELVDLLAARFALDTVVALAASPEAAAAAAAEPARDDLADGVAVLLDAMGLDVASTTDDVLLVLADIVDAVLLAGPELLRLRAWEASYREPVLGRIAARGRTLAELPVADEPASRAQVVTCIDVRSEPLRRHLEALGPWETLGAAGFFGIPLRHVGPAGASSDRLPALLRPDREVTETGTCTLLGSTAGSLEHSAHGPDHVAGAAFALADAAGWVAGPWSLLRTFAPLTAGRLLARWHGISRPRRTRLQVEASAAAPLGFALDELAYHAQAFLGVLGLDRPAPVVVLLGHGAHVTNQPHVAAYECGACGGTSGDVSARTMAQVLNDARVRDLLASRGTRIPEGTVFLAGLHSTTDDDVRLLDDVPADAAPVVEDLLADLRAALLQVAEERAEQLPSLPKGGTRRRRELARHGADWAQARPEWGLARNAALVIGPRSLTSGLDLDGRVFLHSYRHDLDADGAALEFLLTAPMVVAQWISAQYWCSTVDPARFGAGDKTLHNVVCRPDFGPSDLTGVLVGARGDLRTGLPWQAVSTHAPVGSDWTSLPQHEPLRLLVVVHAAPAAIDAVLARRDEAARLVAGDWVQLVAVDPSSGQLLGRDPAGHWNDVPDGLVESAPAVV